MHKKKSAKLFLDLAQTLDFDLEPARLSAAHLGAGETSETNSKV